MHCQPIEDILKYYMVCFNTSKMLVTRIMSVFFLQIYHFLVSHDTSIGPLTHQNINTAKYVYKKITKNIKIIHCICSL